MPSAGKTLFSREETAMKYAFCNGHILDGSADMTVREGLALLTDGDRIEAIVPDAGNFSGYQRVDLKGGYLMPGLINLHVHLPGSGKPSSGKGDVAKLVKLLTSNPLTMIAVRKICAGYATPVG